MRKSIIAALLAVAGFVAVLVPTAANATTTSWWRVTGYSITTPSTVVWQPHTFTTKTAAQTFLTKEQGLERQVCPLARVSCATFALVPVHAPW